MGGRSKKGGLFEVKRKEGGSMHLAGLNQTDMANGPGFRVSIFVSGCRNHCEGCFNKETWDFSYGKPFEEYRDFILKELERPYIEGLTVLGGEPFEPENQEGLAPFLEEVKQRFPKKTIWCYTGYTLDKDLLPGERKHTPYTDRMLSFIDVLVDGRFILAERDVTLKFRGSRNQRLIDVKKTREENAVRQISD